LDLPWPADFFSADDLPGFLDSMYVMNAAVINDPGALSFQISVMFVGEAAIAIPGLDGVQLVIGGSLSDLSDIPIIVNPSNPGDPTPEGMPQDVDPLPDMEGMTFLTVQLVISPSPALIFSDISLALRFAPDVLAPADPNGPPVEISTTGSITIDRTFNVQLAGFDALNLSPAAAVDPKNAQRPRGLRGRSPAAGKGRGPSVCRSSTRALDVRASIKRCTASSSEISVRRRPLRASGGSRRSACSSSGASADP
jgi:hypothetical protein